MGSFSVLDTSFTKGSEHGNALIADPASVSLDLPVQQTMSAHSTDIEVNIPPTQTPTSSRKFRVGSNSEVESCIVCVMIRATITNVSDIALLELNDMKLKTVAHVVLCCFFRTLPVYG